ncbi:hypothetical protein LU631_11305 [Erwinia tracheiphila]|uniref:Uncharacterized protein n=1 Tax=Erwinia tracheiphila TaxID=65700 RepID=A0A0M2K811_9GAMM|nr:hypothetical protein [Erwinia tracheiphila]AXF77482.1 hypothetical protein AV903_17825 [Erwinia tracheiphila]KKF34374.1 hypothetical protein SY86_23630 [Erwinia tracheiphila]KKF34463.1 hypothetical protein SY86_01700 [Erwinia tracheiphila]KKF35510.1 hypothetical protein SY86_08850 [Erwinia tracheiphila]KKF35861.1 hypothetical protein SY86_11150 [Erwinia tracheiphila]
MAGFASFRSANSGHLFYIALQKSNGIYGLFWSETRKELISLRDDLTVRKAVMKTKTCQVIGYVALNFTGNEDWNSLVL